MRMFTFLASEEKSSDIFSEIGLICYGNTSTGTFLTGGGVECISADIDYTLL